MEVGLRGCDFALFWGAMERDSDRGTKGWEYIQYLGGLEGILIGPWGLTGLEVKGLTAVKGVDLGLVWTVVEVGKKMNIGGALFIDGKSFLSDDEPFSDEDILKKIYSNPFFDEEIISIKIDPRHFDAESDLIESLLNQDSSIISSSKIDYLLDEFVGELILLKSIPPGIDEADCDLEEEIHLIEKYDSLMEEIDLSVTPDDSMPPGIENDDYDSEGHILILEELLSHDTLSLLENESFHFDIPSSHRPPAKPPDDDEIKPNSGILTVKVVGDISEHYVLMPRPLPTQPTLALNQENLLISYLIRALKLFSFLLKAC
nr:hypothetical protein [Tanacetum cinerariifolium]